MDFVSVFYQKSDWTSLGVCVIPWGMDDIEAIIDASKHFKYHEPTGTTPFNRISHLPESKRHMKMALQDKVYIVGISLMLLLLVVQQTKPRFQKITNLT